MTNSCYIEFVYAVYHVYRRLTQYIIEICRQLLRQHIAIHTTVRFTVCPILVQC